MLFFLQELLNLQFSVSDLQNSIIKGFCSDFNNFANVHKFGVILLLFCILLPQKVSDCRCNEWLLM